VDGWYDDAADAASADHIVSLVGDDATGKGSFDTVKQVFSSNASGEIAILMYGITNDELYIDNVKVYPAE
jgi:hypothetical protein